ncbi:MAG TPA: prepilin-type N-terminal cleavage/methylation domain-containing protein [Phycisphaerae bacterium]|nr:prepilin-type N-terminal cleavage/methylation domain-containing protein [Phycisphaerae bacterium]
MIGERRSGRGGERARGAFTLIELLVVVAVIAILIAIMMPSLARAKAMAQKTRCATNLRSWGVAIQVYANQFENRFPNDGADSPVWGDTSAWFNALPPLVNAKAYVDLQKDYLTKNIKLPLGGNNSIFVCPASSTAMGNAASETDANGYFKTGTPSSPFFVCYVWNSKLNSTTAFFRMTSIPNPASTALMVEKRMQTSEPPRGTPFSIGGNPAPNSLNRMKADAKRFASRHEEGGNVVFADGHVEFFGYRFVEQDQSNFNKPGVLVWDPGSAVTN